MWRESDALVMARVAMGEAPNSFSDRIYVMWIIRLRADLGFGGAGYYSGTRDLPDRWGAPTTIKSEALCHGGCQFSPARVAAGIYFPCRLRSSNPMRGMLCPTDNQLPDFHATVEAADAILSASLADFPHALRGYDGFRAPSVTWEGARHRPGGLEADRFFRGGNVWMDEYDKDNIFWDRYGDALTLSTKPTPRIADGVVEAASLPHGKVRVRLFAR